MKFRYFKIIAILLVLVSCAKRQNQNAYENQILYYGNGLEPESLDPHIVTGLSEYKIIESLYDGLVGVDPKTLEPIADRCAERWEISEDLMAYKFFIRKSATWSNGDPVTAHDFVYSYKRILHPDLASQYAYMLFPIKNAKEFNLGEIKDFGRVGVKAISDSILEIKLKAPTPYLLSLVSHQSWYPVHKATVEKYGSMTNLSSPWAKPGKIVTNGAFKLKDWFINSKVVVKKRRYYWDAKTVKLNEIHFYAITNFETEQRAFRQGKIHVTYTVPPHRINWARKHMPENLLIHEFLGTFYLCVNLKMQEENENLSSKEKEIAKILKDKKVRQAIALAIDRQAVCDSLKGGEKPALHFTPPKTAGYTCRYKIKPSVKKAQKLLAEAGFPEGEGFPEIELLYPTADKNRQLSELLQENFKRDLGISVKLIEQQWKIYLNSVKTYQYQIARSAWIGDYNDPNTFLDMWVTGGGNNRTGFSNADYDRFIKSAANTADVKKRLEYFQKAEKILMQEMPIIPVYFWVRVAMVDTKLRGWHPNILDQHPAKYLWFEVN